MAFEGIEKYYVLELILRFTSRPKAHSKVLSLSRYARFPSKICDVAIDPKSISRIAAWMVACIIHTKSAYLDYVFGAGKRLPLFFSVPKQLSTLPRLLMVLLPCLLAGLILSFFKQLQYNYFSQYSQ